MRSCYYSLVTARRIHSGSLRQSSTRALKHSIDKHFAVYHAIVHGAGKSPRKQPMVTELTVMDPSLQHERINLREQAVEKVFTDTLLLEIIKLPGGGQIVQRRAQDSDLHSNRFFLRVFPIQYINATGGNIGLGLPQFLFVPDWTLKRGIVSSKVRP